ncbi:HAD family hydrolase [Flavobacterium sp.]|uniref:HAD family hydrolase n=1 Tax=Flavobacterium sp. TaxID=239 RepID=UPI003D0D2FA2
MILEKLEDVLNLDFKHYSFDLWLTLVKSNPLYKQKRNQLFKDFFEIDLPLETVSSKIRFFDVSCNAINEQTGLNFDTFQIYSLILNELGYDLTKLSLERLEEFYILTENLFLEFAPELLHPNTKEILLALLEKDKTLNILSNTGFVRGTTIRKYLQNVELSELFSFEIFSDECNLSKPNPKIFEILYQKVNPTLRLSKDEIVHIGDNFFADVQGANNFGISGRLIKITN